MFAHIMCKAQGSIDISGNTTVEVGVPNSYILTFTPPTSLPQGANAFEITQWEVETNFNHIPFNNITGFINQGANQTNFFQQNGFNLPLSIIVPIQWGSDFSPTDEITASVSVRYFATQSNNTIHHSFHSPEQTLEVNIQTIQAPTIGGPSSVQNCAQPNSTHTITNATNGNQFVWSVIGATIVGSNTGTSVVIKASLTGNYTVSCSVRRSTASPDYVKTGSKTVTRLAPTTAAAISGESRICSGSKTYTIQNLPAGHSLFSWSISNTSVATLSNTTGNTTTLTKVGIGTITLTANILNNCNQIIPKTKVINVGPPIISPSANIVGPSTVGTNQTYNYYLSLPATNGVTSYTWSVDAPIDDDPPLCNWHIMYGQGTSSVSIKTGCDPALAVVRVVANSTCGSSNMKYTYVTVYDPCPPTGMRLSQNPITDSGFELYLTAPYPCDEVNGPGKLSQPDFTECVIRIFDLNGKQVYNDKISSNELRIDGLMLDEGIYFLQVITDSGEVITEKIIFE